MDERIGAMKLIEKKRGGKKLGKRMMSFKRNGWMKEWRKKRRKNCWVEKVKDERKNSRDKIDEKKIIGSKKLIRETIVLKELTKEARKKRKNESEERKKKEEWKWRKEHWNNKEITGKNKQIMKADV